MDNLRVEMLHCLACWLSEFFFRVLCLCVLSICLAMRACFNNNNKEDERAHPALRSLDRSFFLLLLLKTKMPTKKKHAIIIKKYKLKTFFN